jgi:hypothetical protein
LSQLIRIDATVWNDDRTNKVALGRVLFRVQKQEVNLATAMEERMNKQSKEKEGSEGAVKVT